MKNNFKVNPATMFMTNKEASKEKELISLKGNNYETNTKKPIKKSLLVTTEISDNLKILKYIENDSINNIICKAIEKYIEEKAEKIQKYKEFFKDE